MRTDGRKANELRPIVFVPDFVVYPEGSVLVAMGKTKVLCNVTVQEGVPNWMREQGVAGGWITAEYALLPRSTHIRTTREEKGLRGRTQEIRRLIGRSLRMAVELETLGQNTVIVDCDVLQADGGTRTAAINGGYLALIIALRKLEQQGLMEGLVLKSPVAAVSAGVVQGEALLDLCYDEDSRAEVDLNVVMNEKGEFIEVQGTGEMNSFSKRTLNVLLDMAEEGVRHILDVQRITLDAYFSEK